MSSIVDDVQGPKDLGKALENALSSLGITNSDSITISTDVLETGKAISRGGTVSDGVKVDNLEWNSVSHETSTLKGATYYRLSVDSTKIDSGFFLVCRSTSHSSFKLIVINESGEVVGEQDSSTGSSSAHSEAVLYFTKFSTYNLSTGGASHNDLSSTIAALTHGTGFLHTASHKPREGDEALAFYSTLDTFYESSKTIQPGQYVVAVQHATMLTRNSYTITAVVAPSNPSDVNGVTASDGEVLQARETLHELKTEYQQARAALLSVLERSVKEESRLCAIMERRSHSYSTMVEEALRGCVNKSNSGSMGSSAHAYDGHSKPSAAPAAAAASPGPRTVTINAPSSSGTPKQSYNKNISSSTSISASTDAPRSASKPPQAPAEPSTPPPAEGNWFTRQLSLGKTRLEAIVKSPQSKTPPPPPPPAAPPPAAPSSSNSSGAPHAAAGPSKPPKPDRPDKPRTSVNLTFAPPVQAPSPVTYTATSSAPSGASRSVSAGSSGSGNGSGKILARYIYSDEDDEAETATVTTQATHSSVGSGIIPASTTMLEAPAVPPPPVPAPPVSAPAVPAPNRAATQPPVPAVPVPAVPAPAVPAPAVPAPPVPSVLPMSLSMDMAAEADAEEEVEEGEEEDAHVATPKVPPPPVPKLPNHSPPVVPVEVESSTVSATVQPEASNEGESGQDNDSVGVCEDTLEANSGTAVPVIAEEEAEPAVTPPVHPSDAVNGSVTEREMEEVADEPEELVVAQEAEDEVVPEELQHAVQVASEPVTMTAEVLAVSDMAVAEEDKEDEDAIEVDPEVPGKGNPFEDYQEESVYSAESPRSASPPSDLEAAVPDDVMEEDDQYIDLEEEDVGSVVQESASHHNDGADVDASLDLSREDELTPPPLDSPPLPVLPPPEVDPPSPIQMRALADVPDTAEPAGADVTDLSAAEELPELVLETPVKRKYTHEAQDRNDVDSDDDSYVPDNPTMDSAGESSPNPAPEPEPEPEPEAVLSTAPPQAPAPAATSEPDFGTERVSINETSSAPADSSSCAPHTESESWATVDPAPAVIHCEEEKEEPAESSLNTTADFADALDFPAHLVSHTAEAPAHGRRPSKANPVVFSTPAQERPAVPAAVWDPHPALADQTPIPMVWDYPTSPSPAGPAVLAPAPAVVTPTIALRAAAQPPAASVSPPTVPMNIFEAVHISPPVPPHKPASFRVPPISGTVPASAPVPPAAPVAVPPIAPRAVAQPRSASASPSTVPMNIFDAVQIAHSPGAAAKKPPPIPAVPAPPVPAVVAPAMPPPKAAKPVPPPKPSLGSISDIAKAVKVLNTTATAFGGSPARSASPAAKPTVPTNSWPSPAPAPSLAPFAAQSRTPVSAPAPAPAPAVGKVGFADWDFSPTPTPTAKAATTPSSATAQSSGWDFPSVPAAKFTGVGSKSADPFATIGVHHGTGSVSSGWDFPAPAASTSGWDFPASTGTSSGGASKSMGFDSFSATAWDTPPAAKASPAGVSTNAFATASAPFASTGSTSNSVWDQPAVTLTPVRAANPRTGLQPSAVPNAALNGAGATAATRPAAAAFAGKGASKFTGADDPFAGLG